MKYQMKVMNADELAKINKLYNEGHDKELAAFGYECANAAITGYRIGIVKSIAKGMCAGIVVCGVLYTVEKIIKKRAAKKTSEVQENPNE